MPWGTTVHSLGTSLSAEFYSVDMFLDSSNYVCPYDIQVESLMKAPVEPSLYEKQINHFVFLYKACFFFLQRPAQNIKYRAKVFVFAHLGNKSADVDII